MARNDGGDNDSGGRSSAELGGAAAAGKSAGKALRGAAGLFGTLAQPNGRRSNAGDELLRRSVSALVEEAVRGRKQGKEEGEAA